VSFDAHARWMDEALALARAGLGSVWPNPSVGCLIVRGSAVVGRGSTQRGGRPHAEVVALAEARGEAKGATAVVSLEPCCHYGQTPPCTEALIDAQIARAIVALEDPDPRVDGAGIRALEAAGIQVVVGVRAQEAREMNAGFFKRVQHGRPLVVVGREPDAWAPDALVCADDGGLVVDVVRETEAPWRIEHPARAADELRLAVAELGARGLTRVFVARDTPLADALLRAGLVDRRDP
jgi:diaminohydroxyphosphoribosylaminopyrimidine deaminase/5-amino-6-(5-phosphoribosylamino)uracil reductase